MLQHALPAGVVTRPWRVVPTSRSTPHLLTSSLRPPHLPAPTADVKYSALNICGILLGLAGSVTYSAVSYIESSTAAARNAKVGAAGGWQWGHSL